MSSASDRIRADQERMLDLLAVVGLRDTATQLRRVSQYERCFDLMEQTYDWARVLERRADELEGK